MSNEDDRQVKQREAGEREVAKLWRAWRTVNEMVQDRGYILSDDEVKITLEQFKQRFSGSDGAIERSMLKFTASPSLELIKRCTDPPTARNPNPAGPTVGTIYIKFNDLENVGIGTLRNFAQLLSQGGHDTGIFISNMNITPAALKIIPAVASETRIETFMETDLLVNITHHELVPTHMLLSSEERAKLLERYRLKDTQLPRIQLSDPIARYYGLKRGQVVKIIRKSETAGRYASYRLCV